VSTGAPAVEWLRAWLDAGALPLTQLPLAFARTFTGWRRTQRTLAGDAFHQDWSETRFVVPPGTRVVLAIAEGNELRWQRGVKGLETDWQASIFRDGSGALRADVVEASRVWRQPEGPWLSRIDTPPDPRWGLPLPELCTTGRWLPLAATADGRGLVAMCAVAKDDTHFRRCGLWQLRPARAAVTPTELRPLLERGRTGERRWP
jgi:hypothetical protein